MDHIKCSVRAIKGRKKWKAKIGTMNKSNKKKAIMHLIDINSTNPIKSVITLNFYGLNIPTKRQGF